MHWKSLNYRRPKKFNYQLGPAMKRIFTLTAGRTGSAWLSEFLAQNIECTAIHEPLEIDDFGQSMPDIKTMRSFNHSGNNDWVRGFWRRKFALIESDVYVETNHTLGKCGLIENVLINNLEDTTSIIILKRDLVKQCCSYVQRGDFLNITIPWQWYLHPTYRLVMVNPEPFQRFGAFAQPLWYCYEMEVRQEYYFRKYSKNISMVRANLEDIVTVGGARALLSDLGYECNPFIPPAKNATAAASDMRLTTQIRDIMGHITLDFDQILGDLSDKGFSF